MRRSVGAALAATALGLLPVFMLGGLAVQMRGDLGFDAAGLGTAVTVFYAVSAVASTTAGRVVQGVGARVAMVVTATLSGVALLGIAAAATSYRSLLAWLVVAGLGNAFAQPAANDLLASDVPTGRQGLYFGVKQAGVPIATLLSGAAVPVIALTVGWRWAFAAGLALAAALVALAGRAHVDRTAVTEGAQPVLPRVALSVVAAAGLLGSAAANCLGVFLVAAAVDAGIGPGAAGVLLAAGSAVGVTARIVLGWRADHRDGGHLRVVSVLLLVGAVGFAGLGADVGPAVFVAATACAFAAGWGWNGLFTFAVARSYPGAVAAATGITQTGLWLGGVVGPVTFGRLVTATSFATAWRVAALTLVCAAGTALVGRRLVLAARAV